MAYYNVFKKNMESSKNYNKFITNNIKNLKQRKTKFKNE
jgi:hypothetical protein